MYSHLSKSWYCILSACDNGKNGPSSRFCVAVGYEGDRSEAVHDCYEHTDCAFFLSHNTYVLPQKWLGEHDHIACDIL